MKKISQVNKLIRPNIANILPYSPGRPIEEVKRELRLRKVIKMASNENALGPSTKVVEVIKDSLNEINLYPDGSAFYLKKKLSEKIGVEESELFLGNGTDEIIRVIAETFLKSGEEVLMGWPSFVIYSTASQIMDAKVIRMPLQNFTYNLKAILEAITDKTKIIFISNPNNPTGTMVDENEVKSFTQKVPEEVIVVFDEAYYEYAKGNFPNTLQYIRDERNIIILRTFSKIYGLAGLRVGYGIARKEIFEEMNKIRQPFNVNRIAQIAAIAALDDVEYLRKSQEMNENGKEFLYRELEKIGVEYVPTSANFLLINTKQNGKIVYEKLLKKGIIVRAMEEYDLPSFIRVTIGKLNQNRQFIQLFKEII